MTTQRDASGQNTYRPPVANVTPDIFQLAGGAQQQGAGIPRFPPKITVQKLDRDGDLYYWKAEIYDLRGGLNLQRGSFPDSHDHVASSTLDTRHPRHLILPPLNVSASTPSVGTLSSAGLYGVNVFGVLCLAGGVTDGSGNGPILFKETSATDPTIASITYNPGTGYLVNWASAVQLNGYSDTLWLVGFGNKAAKVFSDAAGTVAGTMHANTTNMSGAIQSPISGDDNPLLIYANSTISTLAASAAINTAPTVALSSVPDGGWALGLLGLGGAPLRAWWVWPRISVGLPKGTDNLMSSTYIDYGARVISTNLQGTDPQELSGFDLQIKMAYIIRNGIVASDCDRVVFHNGRFIKDLRWKYDRTADSDKDIRCVGMYIVGNDLYVEVNQRASASGTGATKRWIEWYDWDLDAWHQVTTTETLGATTDLQSIVGYGSAVTASKSTGCLHAFMTDDETWKHVFQPPPSVNPFTLRKTSGASSGTGIQFQSSGTATLPAFQIPGLENWPLVVRRISGSPDVDAGGTGGTPATVTVSIPGTSFASGNSPAVFKTGYQTGVNYGRGFQMFSSQDNSVVYELQPSISITQQSGGTDPTRFTCQALPIIIEGLAYRPDASVFESGFMPVDNRG